MDKKDPKDPKYLGVPNISFSLTREEDSREEKYSKQRIERGFDDSELWSLRDTIANFIIPRLERYEEIAQDVIERDKSLVEDIDIFLQSMKLMARDGGTCIFTKEEEEIVNKGLENFPKIFWSLWY